jgi:hypothetical protein
MRHYGSWWRCGRFGVAPPTAPRNMYLIVNRSVFRFFGRMLPRQIDHRIIFAGGGSTNGGTTLQEGQSKQVLFRARFSKATPVSGATHRRRYDVGGIALDTFTGLAILSCIVRLLFVVARCSKIHQVHRDRSGNWGRLWCLRLVCRCHNIKVVNVSRIYGRRIRL